MSIQSRSESCGGVWFAPFVIAVLWSTSAAAVSYPRYNWVYGIATHNSYWINRSDQADFFASGTQEALSDQLLHDHVRALEIDIHSEAAPFGDWRVHHTSGAEDYSCSPLSECLQMLRTFHYALPEHEAINVVIELKNVLCTGNVYCLTPVLYNFAEPDHTIQQFDDLLRQYLGPWLYTPADFLARCAPNETMRQCAREAGWPTIDLLRGKFIVNILGNWSTAAYDWVQYAKGDMRQRVAFPVQSVFHLAPQPAPTGDCCEVVGGGYEQKGFLVHLPSLPYTVPSRCTCSVADDPCCPPCVGGTADEYCISDIDSSFDPSPVIDSAERRAAFDASVFWQVEDVTDEAKPAVDEFLDQGGIVRGADSFNWFCGNGNPCPTDVPNDASTDSPRGTCAPDGRCQNSRIARRFQLIQTDYPWHFIGDELWGAQSGIPVDPSQRVFDASWISGTTPLAGAPFREPGGRLYFHVPWPADKMYDGTYAGPHLVQSTRVPADAARWWETTVSTTRNGETWGKITYSGILVQDVRPDYALPDRGDGEAPCHLQGTTDVDPNNVADCSRRNYPRSAQENGQGCLHAFSDSGRNSIAVCRQKNYGGSPPLFDASLYQEAVRIFPVVTKNGEPVTDPLGPTPYQYFSASRYSACPRSGLPNSDDTYGHPQCVGSMIAMAVQNEGTSSVVRLFSAGKLLPSPSDMPDWNLLLEERFDEPMTVQGLGAGKDVLFVGTRTTTSLRPHSALGLVPDPETLADVRKQDVPDRSLNVPDDGTAKVVDLSVESSDLSITKNDTPDPVVAGGEITYTVTVTNKRPSPASQVQVVDTLPPGLGFESSTVGCAEAPSGTLTCLLGELGGSETRQFEIRARPDPGFLFSAGGPSILTNTATVSNLAGTGGATIDNQTSADTTATPRPLNVVALNIRPGGRIVAEGDFLVVPPDDRLTALAGISARVIDDLGLDRTASAAAAACVTWNAGTIRCRAGNFRATFRPFLHAPNLFRFRLDLSRLAITPPFQPPVRVLLLYDKGVRMGELSQCKATVGAGLRCRTF